VLNFLVGVQYIVLTVHNSENLKQAAICLYR